MFKGREERFREELSAELQPYQTTVVDYEAEERLRTFDVEVGVAGRTLLTSNDRYQVGAAYLVAARNTFITANAISRALLNPQGPDDYRSRSFDRGAIAGFLHESYQTSYRALETADTIIAQKGYKADTQHVQGLEAVAFARRWPAAQAISRRFLEGSIEAAEAIAGYTFAQYDAIRQTPRLSPSFKSHLEGRLSPLFNDIDTRRNTMSRVVNNGLLRSHPETAIRDAYDDAAVAIGALSKVGLWLTYPVLYDPLFRVRQPIEEARPGERRFNPTIMGPLPPAPPARPQRPPMPARPFNPAVLPPLPPAQEKPSPSTSDSARPFDPSILRPPVSQTEEGKPSRPAHERPFNPSILNPGKPSSPRSDRPFDPRILQRAPEEQPDNEQSEEE